MHLYSSAFRRTWAEIDLGAARQNFCRIRERTESGICCVVKANAYGHGAVALARLYESLGADHLAVASIEEGLELRHGGITLPVLVLGYTPPACAPILSENDLTQCVFSRAYGEALSDHARAAGVRVRVHIKLDTGMGRIGFACFEKHSELADAVSVCRSPCLLPEGIFTHFAEADSPDGGEVTAAQFARFTSGIRYMAENGISFRWRHAAGSAAVFSYPATHLDMVRAGIALYGLSLGGAPEIALRPVMTLKSVLFHIKTVPEGGRIGYGGTFTAPHAMRVGTVALGYADGLPRAAGGGRYAFSVRGRRAPILGRICMDQTMVDLSDIPCDIGDEVCIFGRENGCTAAALAAAAGTIGYEILCAVSERVPRLYIQGDA